MPKGKRCYELWCVNDKGYFIMFGTAYFNQKQLMYNIRNNPQTHYVVHKGRIRMWCRFVVSRLFGYS